MYVTIKVSWLVFVALVVLVGFCCWRYPRTVVPFTVGIAAAGVLAVILHL
jgi:hypothetical protein